MKMKGSLVIAIISAIVSLLLLITAVLKLSGSHLFKEKPSIKLTNQITNNNDDWTISIMHKLGDFEMLNPLSTEHHKKSVFLIKNNLSLNTYKDEFENKLKQLSYTYRFHSKTSDNYDILTILYEDRSQFLSIIEIRKSKSTQIKQDIPENLENNKKHSNEKPSYIAIVIDDVGRSTSLEKDFLNYPYPLTFAVLPFELYSKSFSKNAHRHRKEVIIHAPMEGHEEDHPYLEINSNSTNEDLYKSIRLFREEVPYAIGMNNHQGSKATQDPELMKRFFSYYKKTPLFFLDSRTTPNTLAGSTARKMGIPTLERDIFLDNNDDLNYISSQIIKLIRKGRSGKIAIGIGHFTKQNTLKALQRFIPYFKEHNVHLLPISRVLSKKNLYVSLRN